MDKRAIRLIILLTLCFAVFYSLGSYGQSNNIYGTYLDTDGHKKLEINPNGTFQLIYTDNFLERTKRRHLTKLSFGDWRKESNFLVLNSSYSIKSDVLDVVVEEKIDKGDSLRFDICSPYEAFEKGRGLRIFRYEIYIDSDDPFVTYGISANSSTIVERVDRNFSINGFALAIVPDPYLYPGDNMAFNFLRTRLYTPKNKKSNYFKITIPDHTLDYLGYIRFKEEYVKVIDKNTVQLRGEKFKKK